MSLVLKEGPAQSSGVLGASRPTAGHRCCPWAPGHILPDPFQWCPPASGSCHSHVLISPHPSHLSPAREPLRARGSRAQLLLSGSPPDLPPPLPLVPGESPGSACFSVSCCTDWKCSLPGAGVGALLTGPQPLTILHCLMPRILILDFSCTFAHFLLNSGGKIPSWLEAEV